MIRQFKSFFKAKGGVAMVEFAIALPVLIILSIGTVEMTRYILFNQKLDKATNAFGDLVAQNQALCESDLASIANTGIPRMLEPFVADSNLSVTASFVELITDPVTLTRTPLVYEQRAFPFNRSIAASIMAPGGIGSQPNIDFFDFNLGGSNIVAIESTYDYRLIVEAEFIKEIIDIPETGIYRWAIVKPRFGSRLEILSDASDECRTLSYDSIGENILLGSSEGDQLGDGESYTIAASSIPSAINIPQLPVGVSVPALPACDNCARACAARCNAWQACTGSACNCCIYPSCLGTPVCPHPTDGGDDDSSDDDGGFDGSTDGAGVSSSDDGTGLDGGSDDGSSDSGGGGGSDSGGGGGGGSSGGGGG